MCGGKVSTKLSFVRQSKGFSFSGSPSDIGHTFLAALSRLFSSYLSKAAGPKLLRKLCASKL
jgi:hypothetical protein